jgi:hypothetical protein
LFLLLISFITDIKTIIACVQVSMSPFGYIPQPLKDCIAIMRKLPAQFNLKNHVEGEIVFFTLYSQIGSPHHNRPCLSGDVFLDFFQVVGSGVRSDWSSPRIGQYTPVNCLCVIHKLDTNNDFVRVFIEIGCGVGKGVIGRPVLSPLVSGGVSVGIDINEGMIASSNELLNHVVENQPEYKFKVHTHTNMYK